MHGECMRREGEPYHQHIVVQLIDEDSYQATTA